MLTITWPKVTGATMNIVIIFAAIIIPLDCPNNRAHWPIPEAIFIWECGDEFTRGVPLLFLAPYEENKQTSDSLANLARRLRNETEKVGEAETRLPNA